MFTVVLTIHIVLSVMLIGLVLLQQGKGADAGATFGGGGNTVFGAAGAGDLLTKVTTILAVSFMVTSILLVKMYQNGTYLSSAKVNTADSVLEGSLIKEEAPSSANKELNTEKAVDNNNTMTTDVKQKSQEAKADK